MTQEDPVDLGLHLHAQALDAWGEGELDAALGFATEARALLSAADGDDHPDVANITVALAGITNDQGQRERACELYEEALAGLGQWREQLPEIQPIYIRALDECASAYRARGLHEEAENRHLEALRLAVQHLGEDHLITGRIHNSLGILYKYMARFDEARAHYAVAQLAIEDAIERGETDQTDLASIYHNLGGLAHSRGNYTEAQAPARKALALRESVLGLKHPDVMADAGALASILEALGQNEEAETLFRRCLSYFEGHFGPDHYEVAVTLSSLGLLLMDTARLPEAEECLRRSLGLKETLLGDGHPETALTAHNLGFLLMRDNRKAEARGYFARSLRDLSATLDVDHPHVVAARLHLGQLEAS